jgi:response regulator of citrate/malate metabolism
VQRVPGFEVAGVVHFAAEAQRFCQRRAVDVILLDFYLPDTHGLYLPKPFAFAEMRDTLERYAQFRQCVPRSGEVFGQVDVDDIWHRLRSIGHLTLPKGMSGETLRAITEALIAAPGGLSAAEAAHAIGVSRVTARDYLKYLADKGLAQRGLRHGHVGRPEVRFYPAQSSRGPKSR